MKKLSVIVPHYNSIDTLRRLILSIPDREEIEIVIVDDGSSYSIDFISISIAEYIGDRDVKVIQNNTGVKGPGGARNQGMEVASGEWLLFADSDDSFVDDMYYFVSEYFEKDTDMVYFCPTGINAETNEPSYRHIRYVDVVSKASKNPTMKNITEMKYGFCTPWSKLFRASVAKDNRLSYGKTMQSEDVYFVTQFAYHAKNVMADERVIYCVTRSPDTLSSKKTERDFDDKIDVMIWRYNYLKSKLSKREFAYTNMEWYALAKAADSVLGGWGINKLFEVLKKYKEEDVSIFNMALLNPLVFIRNIEIELRLWKELKSNK